MSLSLPLTYLSGANHQPAGRTAEKNNDLSYSLLLMTFPWIYQRPYAVMYLGRIMKSTVRELYENPPTLYPGCFPRYLSQTHLSKKPVNASFKGRSTHAAQPAGRLLLPSAVFHGHTGMLPDCTGAKRGLARSPGSLHQGLVSKSRGIKDNKRPGSMSGSFCWYLLILGVISLSAWKRSSGLPGLPNRTCTGPSPLSVWRQGSGPGRAHGRVTVS